MEYNTKNHSAKSPEDLGDVSTEVRMFPYAEKRCVVNKLAHSLVNMHL